MVKSFALGILVLVSLTLGALLLQARRQITAQAAQLATLETSVARQRDELQANARTAAALQQKQDQLAAKAKAARQSLLKERAAAMTPAAAPATAASTSAPGDTPDAKKKGANPFTDSIAKMMKDPAMKGMMRSAQAGALRQMYGDLVKQWALSPEETNTFYDLLLDKQTDQMDRGMKILEDGPDAVSPADLASSDDKIKASLGDDLYQQYKDYEKTIGGRSTVNQLQQQLSGGNTALLTADQSKVLIQAITEEPANMPPGSYASLTGNSANPMAMDPAQIDQFMKTQGDLNARIDARVADVLSPEQLQAFKDQQQQTLATQRAGMEMAAKMYGPTPTPGVGP